MVLLTSRPVLSGETIPLFSEYRSRIELHHPSPVTGRPIKIPRQRDTGELLELVSDRGGVRTRTVTPSSITLALPSAEQQSENSSSGFITPPPRPKMKPPKPSTFDPKGSNPEALESWLDQMNSYFILAETEETNKNEKVLTASFYLAGDARDWYRTEKAKLTSWAEFEKRMRSQFIPSNYCITLVQQWDKLGWQKGQTVAQYSNEIKSLALRLNKSDEDKVHKLVFRGNPRLITQLVTQMGTADAAPAADATADKYDAIEKTALNLEEPFVIADAAHPQRQFFPRTLPVSSTPKRTPQASMASQGNWRSPTPNRSTTPS